MKDYLVSAVLIVIFGCLFSISSKLDASSVAFYEQQNGLIAELNATKAAFNTFYAQQNGYNQQQNGFNQGLIAELNATKAAFNTFYAQQNGYNQQQNGFNQGLIAELNATKAAFNTFYTQQNGYNQDLAVFVNELLFSTFTMKSASRVKKCSQESVFYIKHAYGTCSAFAYATSGMPDAQGKESALGAILVSAAHCFIDAKGAVYDFSLSPITAQTLNSPPQICTLMSTFGQPSDSAVLYCPAIVGIPPLRRRSGAADFFLPAAVVGFGWDSVIASEYTLPYQNKSLFIRLSYIGTTLGIGPPAHVTSHHGTNSLGYRVAGVVEQGTVSGMSGGPAMDSSCGVLGVNHATAQSSGFAGLDEVDNFLRGFRVAPVHSDHVKDAIVTVKGPPI